MHLDGTMMVVLDGLLTGERDGIFHEHRSHAEGCSSGIYDASQLWELTGVINVWPAHIVIGAVPEHRNR